MTKYIKIISILLACLMLFVLGNTMVCAKETYEDIFVERLRLNFNESGDLTDIYEYDEIYYHYEDNASAPEYILVKAVRSYAANMEIVRYVGDYVVYSNVIHSPDALGYYIYVPSEDKIYTLGEAYESNIDGIKDVFVGEYVPCEMMGDADSNGKVNVKDVTFIQKYLAKQISPLSYLNYCAMDYDRDEFVNIKDATAIQKHIARIVE